MSSLKVLIFRMQPISGNRIPTDVRKAIYEEDVFNLGGIYGDNYAGDPGGDDTNHYHRIVVSLKETIRLMTEIGRGHLRPRRLASGLLGQEGKLC